MDGIGIVEAAKRSGLTREQIVYIERRGYLGVVVRYQGARRFSEAQLAKLKMIGSCRAAGLRLDDASTIVGHGAEISEEELRRLYALVAAKAEAIRRDLQAWEYVFSLLQAARNHTQSKDAA